MFASCLLHAPLALALEADETRGKQIYVQGTSASGDEINAVVGDEGVILPGSALTCASCHGYDGLGRPEGGVLPPDIRWSQLAKTYGHVHEDGRRHAAFDEANFALMMRAGLDPSDNLLDRVMPLYQMSDQDLADLIAYMKRLESDLDPGVEDGRIQVASLLPLEGPAGALGQAMAQVMHAYFAEVNEQGGMFGRRVELLVVPFGESAEASIDKLRQAFAAEGIFSLVGAYTVGLDEPILELLREDNVPLVGPFTLDPGDSFVDAAAFYLYPGFDEQACVLADRAIADGADATRVHVVGPDGDRGDRFVRAVQDQLRQGYGGDVPATQRYPTGEFDAAGLADRVRDNASEALIFFGHQVDLEALLAALAAKGSSPNVYVLSSFISRPLYGAPMEFNRKIFVAYPTFTSDITADGRANYQALAERHALPREHIQAQIAALAAAKVLLEGLRRAGRDLSRERLVVGIEALYTFQTGLTPPLTYGPNRRIGARGAHVLAVDIENKTYTPVGKSWHEVR
jgi:ABC-type branched-subunit amino acid transport system substrate-binding protein